MNPGSTPVPHTICLPHSLSPPPYVPAVLTRLRAATHSVPICRLAQLTDLKHAPRPMGGRSPHAPPLPQPTTYHTTFLLSATRVPPLPQLMFPELKPAIRWLASRLPDAKQSAFMASRRRVAQESRRIMDTWQQQQQQQRGGAGGSGAGAGGGAGSMTGSSAAGPVSSTSFMAAMLEGRRGASKEDRLTDTQVGVCVGLVGANGDGKVVVVEEGPGVGLAGVAATQATTCSAGGAGAPAPPA